MLSVNVGFIIGIADKFIYAPFIQVSLIGVLAIKLTFAIKVCVTVFVCKPTNLNVLFPLVVTVTVFV